MRAHNGLLSGQLGQQFGAIPSCGTLVQADVSVWWRAGARVLMLSRASDSHCTARHRAHCSRLRWRPCLIQPCDCLFQDRSPRRLRCLSERRLSGTASYTGRSEVTVISIISTGRRSAVAGPLGLVQPHRIRAVRPLGDAAGDLARPVRGHRAEGGDDPTVAESALFSLARGPARPFRHGNVCRLDV